MSEDKKTQGFLKSISELSFVKKLKSIKHIEIIIVVIFVLILLLICFSGNNVFGFLSKAEKASTSSSVSTQTYFSASEYTLKMENKLKNVLSQIKDVGKVEVMISIDNDAEIVFATDEVITTSGQTIKTENNIIFIESGGEKKPIIINEKMPNVSGVVIVSSGAKDTKVKLDIISAVETLLDIDSSKIQVFVGN